MSFSMNVKNEILSLQSEKTEKISLLSSYVRNNAVITTDSILINTENIEISNMNMQSYSTTADSEHSSITSIYPMENGMSYSKFYTNTYDNLFEMFNNANYTTSYMHGNEAKFWNRGNVYSKFGVQNIELKDKFDDKEYINGFMSDEVLYMQGVEKIKNYQNPFMSFIVSASSHTPFELEGLQDRNKVRIDVGKYKGTYFGNYLEAVNYADYAFGVFLEGLKQDGLYDDTTILVFGDHNGINMYNEEMLEFLKQYNPDFEFGGKVLEKNEEGKDIIEIRNRLQVGDSMELLVPNELEPKKFTIEEMWDVETKESITHVNPGKEGQKVILKIPTEAKEGWILRRKK